MSDRIFTPILGMITSVISFDIWQNIILSFLLAFVGGVAAWVARRLCEYISNKIKTQKHGKN